MIRKFDETEQYDTSMKIIFATNNAHKLSEVQAVLGPDFELVTPRSVGITEEIPEQQDTIAGNASQKARYVHDRTGCDCFADDTGLEVEALGGAPGVHSARYATDGHDFAANNELLLRNLEGVGNRRARFRTVISLILDGRGAPLRRDRRGAHRPVRFGLRRLRLRPALHSRMECQDLRRNGPGREKRSLAPGPRRA